MSTTNKLANTEENLLNTLTKINSTIDDFETYIKNDLNFNNILHNNSTIFNLSRMFTSSNNSLYYNELYNNINNLSINFKMKIKQSFPSDSLVHNVTEVIFNNYVKTYSNILPFITTNRVTFNNYIMSNLNESNLENDLLKLLSYNMVKTLKDNNIILNRVGKNDLLNYLILINLNIIEQQQNSTNIQVMNNGYVNQQPPIPQQQYYNNIPYSEEHSNQIKASNLVKGSSSNVIKIPANQFHTELMNLDTNSRVLKFTSKNLTESFATKIVNLKLTIIDIINDIIIKNNICEINKIELTFDCSGEITVNINDFILTFNLPIALSNEDGYLVIELQERVQIIIREREHDNLEIVD